MTQILALDPGPTHTGWCLYDGQKPLKWGKDTNLDVLGKRFYDGWKSPETVAIEAVVSYGQGFDKSLRDTIAWAGVFAYVYGGADAVTGDVSPVRWVTRQKVKLHLCGTAMGVNDSVIRKALIDRFGGPTALLARPKCSACKGRGRVTCTTCRGRKKISNGAVCVCVHHQAEGIPQSGRELCVPCQGIGKAASTQDGVLHGVTADAWSALAVAVTAWETKP